MRNSTTPFGVPLPTGAFVRAAFLVFAVAAWPSGAQAQTSSIQSSGQITTAPPGVTLSHGDVGETPQMIQMKSQLMIQRNIERQRKLVEDTNRLVAMANQLKVSVDKTTKDVLSIEVLKQADEVEKLARSVKEKMRAD